jgi:hypothetical protein
VHAPHGCDILSRTNHQDFSLLGYNVVLQAFYNGCTAFWKADDVA